MKIVGLLRVRNVGEYIDITLGHMASFCDHVIALDDQSTDNTRSLLISNPLVIDVIYTRRRDRDRGRAEWSQRQELLECARSHFGNDPSVWFVYQDGDEFIEWDFSRIRSFMPNIIGIRMRLFDYYITQEDRDLHFLFRKKLGPEYREILMVFRNHPNLRYKNFDQREVHLNQGGGVVLKEGFVRHYGKAISVEAWKKKCQYYINEFPKYSEKWRKRLNHPIHNRSSFGLPLITWEEREEKGILLTRKIEEGSIY